MNSPYQAPKTNVDLESNPDGSKKLVTISNIYIINLAMLIGYIISTYLDDLIPELLPLFTEEHPILIRYLIIFLPALLAGLLIWLVRSRIKITPTRSSLILLTLGNIFYLSAMFSFSNVYNEMLENGTEGSGILMMLGIKLLSYIPMIFIGIGFYILLTNDWKIVFRKESLDKETE
jgi:hypothetical protein